MSKTILLADDSLTIQKVVELTFMEEDYEVVAVSNGDEALAKLGEVTPALVISDIHMPGASGFEVCRRAKESHPGVPVLLLVGTFETFDEAEVADCGAEGHLKKPFDSQELLRLAETLVEGARGGAGQAEATAPQEGYGVATVPEPDTTLLMDENESPPRALEEATPAAQDEPVEELPQEALAEPVSTGEFEALGGAVPEVEAVAAPPVLEESPAEPVSETAAPAEEPPTAAASTPVAESGRLSDDDVERIARRVVELISDKAVREVSWDVIPDLAEVVIKDRLRELESQID